MAVYFWEKQKETESINENLRTWRDDIRARSVIGVVKVITAVSVQGN